MAARGGIKHVWGPLRALLRKLPETRVLLILSLATGILCGFAAVALRLSIHYIQDGLSALFHGARWSFLVLPGVGMLISLLIVKYLVRDDIGHGVTKVLKAVSKNESRIKSHNTWSSLLTSAITIGFGGSVGAEAPIVYTGAAIGSNLGRYCGMSYRGMTLLLGCGAAGAAIAYQYQIGVFTVYCFIVNNIVSSKFDLVHETAYKIACDCVACSDRIPFFVMSKTSDMIAPSLSERRHYRNSGLRVSFERLPFLITLPGKLAVYDLYLGLIRNGNTLTKMPYYLVHQEYYRHSVLLREIERSDNESVCLFNRRRRKSNNRMVSVRAPSGLHDVCLGR